MSGFSNATAMTHTDHAFVEGAILFDNYFDDNNEIQKDIDNE